MPLLERLEPRELLARPDPSPAENVRFRLPLSSDVTTHYYYDRDDTSAAHAWDGSTHTYDGHHGTDFSGGPRGRPVFAAADGILIATVDGFPDQGGSGNGNYVRLNHGNDRNGNPINSVYLHFNAGTVTTKLLGSFISAGEQIGGVGTSGNSTGLHLHFETQVARVAFDPFAAAGSSEKSWWVNQGSGAPSTAANAPKLKTGDAVQVYDLPGSTLNVRNTPAGTSIGAAANNAIGTVLEGPTFGAFNGDYNNNLWVWYRVRWDNGLEGWSTQNWLRSPVDPTPPTIQNAAFIFETQPHKLQVSFSENVAASLAATDFSVTSIGSATPVTSTLSYDASTNRATLNFGRVLPDGNYRLSIPAGAVSDADGNPNAAGFTYDFHVLAGDANRDRRVDFADLVILAQNYGQTGRSFSQGNVDYSVDGAINFGDLVVIAQRYNSGMSAPLAAVTDLPTEKKRRRF